jgi:hypothetical protein
MHKEKNDDRLDKREWRARWERGWEEGRKKCAIKKITGLMATWHSEFVQT